MWLNQNPVEILLSQSFTCDNYQESPVYLKFAVASFTEGWASAILIIDWTRIHIIYFCSMYYVGAISDTISEDNFLNENWFPSSFLTCVKITFFFFLDKIFLDYFHILFK